MSRYIGPDYRICMITPDGKKANPRNWTDAQIQKAILRWPEIAYWFATLEQPKAKKEEKQNT
jgi:hypothetical protein